MTMETVLLVLAAFALVLIGYVFGMDFALHRRCQLHQENQRLKQMLDDMKRMEEFSFKAYCAMIREASCQPQNPSLGNKK